MHAKPVFVALCVCLAVPIAAEARQGPGQLTVVAPDKDAVSYDKWTDRAAARLSRSIRNASSLYRDSDSTGYSRVQFRLNDQGKPQNIELAGPSSSRSINRISMRAIKAMGTLHPLPRDVGPNRKFEAWIIVANTASEKEEMLGALQKQYRAQVMVQAEAERPVLIAQR